MDFETYKNNVIHHEVGHWFVANKLKLNPGNIKIEIKKCHSGFSHSATSHIDLAPSLKNLADVKTYLINRICVLYAGTAFQSEQEDRSADQILECEGKDDYSKLNELCFVLRGLNHPDNTQKCHELDQRNEIAIECWGKVMKIRSHYHKEILNLTDYISNKVKETDKKYTFTCKEIKQKINR